MIRNGCVGTFLNQLDRQFSRCFITSFSHGDRICSIRTRFNCVSTFWAFVVEIVRVNLDDLIPINATCVLTTRTVKSCLVRQLTLSVVIHGSHTRIYYPNGDKAEVQRCSNNRLHYFWNDGLWNFHYSQCSGSLSSESLALSLMSTRSVRTTGILSNIGVVLSNTAAYLLCSD